MSEEERSENEKDRKEGKKESGPAYLEKTLQTKLAEEHQLLGQDLSSQERDIIDCFDKPRLILQRIYIIYNQSRQAMGVTILKEPEIRELLQSLADKKYIRIEKFEYNGEEKEAFILTDKGKQLLR